MPADIGTKGTIACIGAGNVGRAWATVFARAGFTVRLYDAGVSVVRTRALPAILGTLTDLAGCGLLDEAPAEIAGRVIPVASVADAVTGVVHVQESVPEDADVKRAVFDEIAAAAPPDAVLASSTSALPGSTFMEAVSGRHRALVAHPVNPPSLIPLVELCPTPWTDPAVVDRTASLMEAAGMRPVRLTRELPGFLLNRLQYTLVAEALHLVGEGYCTPEDVDAVITHGLAMRWAFIGPFEVAHLNASAGYRSFVASLGSVMRTVAHDARTDYVWPEGLTDRIHDALAARVPVASIADRQAWRDRRIMLLRKHLAEAEAEAALDRTPDD